MRNLKCQKKGVSICVIFLFLFLFGMNFIFGYEKKIVVKLEIQKPDVKNIQLPTDEKGEKMAYFQRIRLEDAYNYGKPGEPSLPHRTARILIPPECEIGTVNVITGEEIELDGDIFIEHVQVQIPATQKSFIYTAPNPKIYQSANAFPESIYSKPSYQFFRGFKIVLIEFIPFKYKYVGANKSNLLSYYNKITLEITFKKGKIISSLFRGKDQDFEKVRKMVDNPDDAIKYYKKEEQKERNRDSKLPPGKWDMVIITNSSLQPVFQDYADWRTTRRGIRTIVCDIDEIYSRYQGIDLAGQLRNFIIDAYKTWGIEYVLLGGDEDIIPCRKLYCAVKDINDINCDEIPADIYFAGLDGDWDKNHNQCYGEMMGSEGDEADLISEVYVGRAPVNNSQEAENFCNKIIEYEQSNLSTYRCNWLFFAENLHYTTSGGNYMDDTIRRLEPLNLNITKVYKNLSGTTGHVIESLNAGQRIGNSCSHGSKGDFGLIKTSDLDCLTNTGYSLIYTWACFTNAFDQKEEDCIGEHFIFNKHGAFAFIGNSREGWYLPGKGAIGASHDFELAFYHSLINKEIPRLGDALQDSKETFSGSRFDMYRWITYSLNLLGDPSTLLRLKNDIWIKTSDSDNGSIPALGDCQASPDIAVDSPADGWQIPSPFIDNENPKYSRNNRIYVRVRNFGCADANKVTIRVYWADPSNNLSFSEWDLIDQLFIEVIPCGCDVIAPPIEWNPTDTAIGQCCLFATIECKSDPISICDPRYDNNVARKDITIVK